MGIGLVVAFWLFAALLVGSVFSAAAWGVHLHSPPELRKRRATFAFLLPFGYLAWGCPAGLLWTGWGALSEFNAQFGIGDAWETALPNGYGLVSIDIDDRASISAPGRGTVVSDVTTIAASGSRVFGETAHGAFVLDTDSGRLHTGDEATLLQSRDLDRAALVPVGQYPGRPRTWLDNVVAAALFFIPPTVAAWWIARERLGAVETPPSEAG